MRDLDDLLGELVSQIGALNKRVDELERQPAPIGNGSAQYQYIVTGATPFKPGYSAGYLNIAAGQTLKITTGGILVLGGFTLTVPATGPAALMDHANVGDFYTVAWTDYGVTSTIVGWSSFSIKSIFYKKIGKLVFVTFYIYGVSNSTAVTFTLPYTSKNDALNYMAAIQAFDNSVTLTTPGRMRLPNNSNIVTCYSNFASAVWTASNDKAVIGQFWYEAA